MTISVDHVEMLRLIATERAHVVEVRPEAKYSESHRMGPRPAFAAERVRGGVPTPVSA